MLIHRAYLPMQVRPPASIAIFHSQHAQCDCTIIHFECTMYLQCMLFITFSYHFGPLTLCACRAAFVQSTCSGLKQVLRDRRTSSLELPFRVRPGPKRLIVLTRKNIHKNVCHMWQDLNKNKQTTMCSLLYV